MLGKILWTQSQAGEECPISNTSTVSTVVRSSLGSTLTNYIRTKNNCYGQLLK